MEEITFGYHRAGHVDVSVIVVSKFFPSLRIHAFLHSTKRLTANYELIIVTHQISDLNYHVMINKLLAGQSNLVGVKVVLLRYASDLGPAHDRNVGAKLAGSLNLLFSDDDTVFLEDISGLLHYLQMGKCAGLQPLLLQSTKNEIIDSAGDFVWRSGPTYRPYSKCSKRPLKNLWGGLHVEEVPSMKSALMLVQKDAFFVVGGFDPHFNFNYEDVDLGWRMTRAGYKLLFVPTVRAQHKGGRVSSAVAKHNETLFGLVNFYVTHFKMKRQHVWPCLFLCFQLEFLFLLLKRQAKNCNLKVLLRNFYYVNSQLMKRLRIINLNRASLLKMQTEDGARRFEEMAKGKRYIYRT